MSRNKLPLSEVSVEELFNGSEPTVFEIPIYQRNYAWEKDEISALIQDVYDSYKKNGGSPYYIGTLVSYHKGDRVYEVIDGQQRLTTISLILGALHIKHNNKLTYRARKKSDATLRSIENGKERPDEIDIGIENGYKYTNSAIGDIVPEDSLQGFTAYFNNFVHIIHYIVPKDIDLNHYFEIMNSRGEQLEKHEIVKANLMRELHNDDERRVFNRIWECCAEMNIYTQQNLKDIRPDDIFGTSLYDFLPTSFEDILMSYRSKKNTEEVSDSTVSIASIINNENKGKWTKLDDDTEKKDSFQPIIDFPNFLLIVLKITRMSEPDFSPLDFYLDDKELLHEFNKVSFDEGKVRHFAYILLKARFLLDNYVVHHSKEEDTLDSNPWKLQVWHRDEDSKKTMLKNLCEEKALQDRLTHLLSMFEVSFTARQRKNYLFYCLLYLLNEQRISIEKYYEFVDNLADRYFFKVYLDISKLNAINTPLPGSFDESILLNKHLDSSPIESKDMVVFDQIYGNGTEASRGVPLYIFNYLDYRIWVMYDNELRGEKLKEGSRGRQEFFDWDVLISDLRFLISFIFQGQEEALNTIILKQTQRVRKGILTKIRSIALETMQ